MFDENPTETSPRYYYYGLPEGTRVIEVNPKKKPKLPEDFYLGLVCRVGDINYPVIGQWLFGMKNDYKRRKRVFIRWKEDAPRLTDEQLKTRIDEAYEDMRKEIINDVKDKRREVADGLLPTVSSNLQLYVALSKPEPKSLVEIKHPRLDTEDLIQIIDDAERFIVKTNGEKCLTTRNTTTVSLAIMYLSVRPVGLNAFGRHWKTTVENGKFGVSSTPLV